MRNITVQYQYTVQYRREISAEKILVPQMDAHQKVCQQGRVRVACRGRTRHDRVPRCPLTASLDP